MMNPKFFTKIDEGGNENIYKSDGDLVWFVPKDPANSDYQSYLRFLAGEPEGTLGTNNAQEANQ